MPTSVLAPVLDPPPTPAQELTTPQICNLRFYANVWLGDFNVPGFGAGNVRIGPFYHPDRPADPRSTAFLIDCNLVDMQRFTTELESATLVLGERDFQPQPGSGFPWHSVEVALTKAVEPGNYWRYGRYGQDWIWETKLLGAAVPTSDLRALSAGRGLSFYARLATAQGTLWINLDGVPYRNFDLPEEILLQHAGAGA
jgi:hypothetical protein